MASEEIRGIGELPLLAGDEVVVREAHDSDELVVVDWLPAPQPGVTLELPDAAESPDDTSRSVGD